MEETQQQIIELTAQLATVSETGSLALSKIEATEKGLAEGQQTIVDDDKKIESNPQLLAQIEESQQQINDHSNQIATVSKTVALALSKIEATEKSLAESQQTILDSNENMDSQQQINDHSTQIGVLSKTVALALLKIDETKKGLTESEQTSLDHTNEIEIVAKSKKMILQRMEATMDDLTGG